jgi:hypothetical protein
METFYIPLDNSVAELTRWMQSRMNRLENLRKNQAPGVIIEISERLVGEAKVIVAKAMEDEENNRPQNL